MLEMVEAFLRIRWGENTVHETGLFDVAFTTQFDNTLYTDTLPLDSEAQASNGGSGGPGFTLVNGQWKLSAIMVTANLPRNHQPAETVLFGDQSLFYDLSVFRAEILAIVPKPSSYGLALIAAAAVALARRRRH
jgi:MYXO-CTERM domain-containing protein